MPIKVIKVSERTDIRFGDFLRDNSDGSGGYWVVYFMPSVHFTHWDDTEGAFGKIQGENVISFRFLFFFVEITIKKRG